MSEPVPPDAAEALASAVLRGDPGAFERWFREEHRAVWKLCFGFLARSDEADDLAQDAMLKLHDHLPRWDRARPYRTWRNTVVANLCRDRLRRAALRDHQALGGRGTEPAGHQPSPPDAAASAEVADALCAALATLPPREREVFVLRDLEGAETREVALALGIGESTVRSLATLARRRLRARLAPLVPDGASPKEREG